MCIFCSIIYRKISIQLIIMLIKPVLANYGGDDDDGRYMFIILTPLKPDHPSLPFRDWTAICRFYLVLSHATP